jgi:hypothetical protein
MTNLKQGIVGIDDRFLVYGQWYDHDRWNGWLNPRIDKAAVEHVLTGLNAEKPDDEQMRWTWEDDGTLVLTEIYGPSDQDIEVERLQPNEDGLYALGNYGWVWSEHVLNDDMVRWLEQNDIAKATLTAEQCAQVEGYAEHHAGGLFVLMYERRVGDNWVCTKLHDSWGDDGKVVVHTYDPDLDGDDTTIQREEYFDTGKEAVEAFLRLDDVRDSRDVAEEGATAYVNVSNAVNQILNEAGVPYNDERRAVCEQAGKLAHQAWENRRTAEKEERRG